jgi:hypothetical protein
MLQSDLAEDKTALWTIANSMVTLRRDQNSCSEISTVPLWKPVMNAKAYALVAVILLAFVAGTLAVFSSAHPLFAQEPKQAVEPKSKSLAQQLIGTWKLEEAAEPGSPSGVGTRLKLFTGTHWCVIQPDTDSGVIVFQHGGRYELDGDDVKVSRDFAGESTKEMIGSSGKFKITIDGDTMKQIDPEGVFNETWKRVK